VRDLNLQARLRRMPGLYRHCWSTIDRLAKGDRGEIEAYQAKQLGRVMDRARTLSAAYHGCRSFEQLPYLFKTDVRSNPGAYLRYSLGPTSKKKTSGTTGAALSLHRSFASIVFEQAAIDWVVGQAGHDFGAERVAVFRGADIEQCTIPTRRLWHFEESGRVLVFRSNFLNRMTLPDCIAALRDFRPDILYAYPSAADQLARLLEQENKTFHFPLVVTSSEVLPPGMRQRLASTFGATVVDYYGQGERVCFAYSLADREYRFMPAYGYVEFLRSTNDDAEIIGTSFHNSAQLLLRYRTGDLVTIPNIAEDQLRDVSLGKRSFEGLSGRSNEVLFGPAGEVLVGVNHIPRRFVSLGPFQFVQEARDHVRILVRDPSGGSTEIKDRILADARKKIPLSIAIDVEFTEELLQTRAGKTPFVLHLFETEARESRR
jgi:phenylacetate-coenzyme A ligase PaaK-like adenylate-forming protein